MNDNIDRPEPDSQFRLRPCTCGSEDVVCQSHGTITVGGQNCENAKSE